MLSENIHSHFLFDIELIRKRREENFCTTMLIDVGNGVKRLE